MKKTVLAAFCVAGFLLITGGVIVEDRPHPVLINGKPFANAVTINGVLAISVEDLLKAFGGTGFKVRGTTLSTLGRVEASAAPNTIGRDAASGQATGKRMHKPFVITKEMDVSTPLLFKNAKPYAPLTDIVKAFGGVYNVNQGTLRPGESINLNFAVNGNGALAVQQ